MWAYTLLTSTYWKGSILNGGEGRGVSDCQFRPMEEHDGEHNRVQFYEVDRWVVRRYILSNIETKRGVKRGDRIWQIGFGSGFKCNSAVWCATRNINEQHVAWLDGVEMEHDRKWLDEYEAILATYENLPAEEKLA
jgi:hypothetical protein